MGLLEDKWGPFSIALSEVVTDKFAIAELMYKIRQRSDLLMSIGLFHDGSRAMSGNLPMGNNQIINCAKLIFDSTVDDAIDTNNRNINLGTGSLTGIGILTMSGLIKAVSTTTSGSGAGKIIDTSTDDFTQMLAADLTDYLYMESLSVNQVWIVSALDSASQISIKNATSASDYSGTIPVAEYQIMFSATLWPIKTETGISSTSFTLPKTKNGFDRRMFKVEVAAAPNANAVTLSYGDVNYGYDGSFDILLWADQDQTFSISRPTGTFSYTLKMELPRTAR